MADVRGEVQVITFGGKDSSLASSSVHAIATGQAHLRIDSLALGRLATQFPPPQSVKRCRIPISKTLTLIESRASLVVLANKLLRHPSPLNIRPVLPNQIVDALNLDSGRAVSLEVEVTEEEGLFVENSCADLCGVSALIDHEAALLATTMDAVAALSCEALKGNDTAFNSTDAGDGLVDEDEIGVASAMKVLLSGSKMVGKIPIEAISDIPEVHGELRQFVKSVHSMTRVRLNSAVKPVHGGEMKERKAVASKLGPVFALRNVGASSLSRAKLNVEALGIESCRTGLLTLFE
ncbi:unnamed protein product [Linum trigynum]|uniref:phenylalanine ammonia-lyase n=1 Tax=Linum trigynum TaxID=586398 RepID=A0AAV2G666_9ROSI